MAIIVKVEGDTKQLDTAVQKSAQKAKGEFSGFGKAVEKETKQAGDAFSYISAEAKKAAQGLSSVFGGTGFGGSNTAFSSITNGLRGIVSGAGEASSALSGVAVAGGVVVGVVAAIGVGAVVASKQIVDMALEGGRLADSLKDTADLLAISPDLLERLSVGYALAGKNVESARAAIGKFEVALGQAASGEAPKLLQAFKSLGVDARKASDNIEGAFTQVAGILAESKDRTAAAAAAMALFGRQGLQMITVFRDLKDENSELNRTMQRFGLLAGGDAIAAASKLGDQQDILAKKFDAVKIAIAARLTPSIDTAIDRFITGFTKVEPVILRVADAIGTAIEKVISFGENAARSLDLAKGLPGLDPRFVALLEKEKADERALERLGIQPVISKNLFDQQALVRGLGAGRFPAPSTASLADSAARLKAAQEAAATDENTRKTREFIKQIRGAGTGGGGGRGTADILGVDIEEELQRAATRRSLVGEDLAKVANEAKRVGEQIDIVRDQELVFERAGLTKRQEYLDLKRQEVKLAAEQDEILAKQRDLLRTLPVSQVTGQGLLAALPLTKTSGIAPSSKDTLPEFVVEVDDAVRATRALQRALDDADQSRQELFDSIARNEHFLSTAFEPDPVRDYARALEDASRATASIVENQRFLNEAFNVKPLDLQAGLLDGIVRRMKSSTEILRDTALSSMDTIFDFVDRGFAKITQGMGAFRGVIAQLLSDISRLFLSKVFTQLFGAGSSGGSNINLGAGGGGASGGGFGGLLRGIISGNGGGGFGGFLTPPFNPNAGSQIAIPGSVSAGQSPVGLLNLGGPFGGTQIPGLGGGAAAAGKFSLSGLLGGLAPTFPLLGAGLGSALGGSSVPGKILGGIGGGILGATSAILATGSLFGLSIGLLTNPFTAIAGIGLLVGSALFGRAAQRKKDEKAADEIWVNEMNQIRQLISQVNSDRIDGQEALALAAQLRQQTIAGLNQIKTKSVRESRLTNQLRDLDNGVVAELKRAVERQATRQRIGPQLVPEFATGGRVPGIDQGFDSVIARLRPGEAVLNQSQIALLGGVSALRRARVPGFAEGGQITASTPSGGSNAGGPMTIIFEDVTIDAEGIFVKGARTSKGERVAVQIQRNARKNGRA